MWPAALAYVLASEEQRNALNSAHNRTRNRPARTTRTRRSARSSETTS
jgi:hypothetical protein